MATNESKRVQGWENICINGKTKIILLTIGLIKKVWLNKMSYFPEPYSHSKSEIKAELDLSNYATKYYLKNAAGVDTSKFAKQADLSDLRSDIDKLKIDI